MRIRFVYGTAEWAKICESINLYLQYCHDIAHIKIDICNYTNKEHPCCDVLNDDDIVVIPLFEKDGSEIKSNGLDIVKYLRGKNGYKFNTIFLVLSKQDIPDYLHPENEMHYYAKSLLDNPRFEDVSKAVLLGEIVYEKRKIQNEGTPSEYIEYMNIINLPERDALERLAKLIKQDIKLPLIDGVLRESYYSTFVDYYGCTKDGEKVLDDGAKGTLDAAQEIYNSLNNPDLEVSGHAVSLERFFAPVPFPLQDLFDARQEIEDELSKYNEKNKIKLLLLDNRSDNKFITQSDDTKPQAGPLCSILKEFGLDKLFEIKMLGNTVYKGNLFYKENKEINEIKDYSDFEKEFEEFNFRWFKYDKELNNKTAIEDDDSSFWEKYYELKSYHKKFLEECKKKGIAIKTYSDIINNKIKFSHIVLLDFFLNRENTYLAFDFIRDIAEIKRVKGDSSTTWYFITSAMYDSVVKYSQSGILAEYYESAVVNAGDDPTNKTRQIIFVYKLLTFIQARIRSFKGFHDSVIGSKLLNCKKNNECGKTSCLTESQNMFRKYLAEYGEITKIFPGQEKTEKEFKKTVELLDSTINQFFWLPEADWLMIQRQIEHINSRLEHIEDFKVKERRFLCSYILEEIKKRSEIY